MEFSYLMPSYRWYNKVKERNDDYKNPHQPHDTGYKYLLSSKRIFVELLRSFVKEDWVNQVSEEYLTRVEKSYILSDFDKREADIVYRLQVQERDIYFYILTELQSTVDYRMPWRLLEYQLEIWRDNLNDQRKQMSNHKQFQLPAIIPIVLYNGKSNWTAKRTFRQLINDHETYGNYIVDFEYILIDVNRYDQQELLTMQNLISSVFLVEKSTSISDMSVKLKKIKHVLRQLDEKDYRTLLRWIAWFVKHNDKEAETKRIDKLFDHVNPKEVDEMISEVEKFGEKERMMWKLEGKNEGKIEVARSLLNAGLLPVDKISEVTGIPVEQILNQK